MRLAYLNDTVHIRLSIGTSGRLTNEITGNAIYKTSFQLYHR